MTAHTASAGFVSPPVGASALMAGFLSPLPGVPLTTVVASAALQTRTDRKYLVPLDRFAAFVALLPERMAVLDIDQRRLFRYESVYFDTPDQSLYRQHLQGRRRRYKVRSRTYLDSGDCMFEVKLKGRRSQTVKVRMPYEVGDRHTITNDARSFLDRTLNDQYGLMSPELEPTLTTTYTRATLVDLRHGARLTCDVDLVCSGRGQVAAGATGHVLVESKSDGRDSTADRLLRGLGVRPVGLSKYCIGTALVDPAMPANPWNRTLRQYFLWESQRRVHATTGPGFATDAFDNRVQSR
jgi:VTC domain